MYAIEMKADAMLPRERLRDLGAEHLSNQELLSILLRTGTKSNPSFGSCQSNLEKFR